ncbi:MAG: proton-conducting transporter membrane subunit [Anaerolineales bacterium]|jgi:formate hydrogenlyase subunit 3/multisubunit Na+/H+ antiporter MnhD subunit
MSAPVLWILLPLVFASLLLIISNQKAIFLVACLLSLFLAMAAWLLPIDTVLTIGSWTFKLAPSVEILGRNLTLTSANRSFLVLIYGSALFWFIPVASLQIARRMIPLGLAITSLLVAALAVQPFLYAALIIEVAVLISIPLLTPSGQNPGKGVIRFLIFQSLGVPFILFSGWLLAGIGANPGDLGLVQQAATFLGLGFAFLLAIFPFYTWIPLLAEEAHPYVVGFLLWMLPTVTLFYGLGFLDSYTWLRDATFLNTFLTLVGTLMVVTGGLLAAFQHHLGKIMGYAIIVETGFSLLALSLGNTSGLNIFLLLLVPRAISLAIWALTLSILREQAPGLSLKDVKGLAHIWPFTTSALVLANLALAGMPLLAGFPAHQAVWEGLARSSLTVAFWVLIGSLGLFASAVRVLAALTAAPEGTPWGARENRTQRLLLAIGVVGLFILGLFPEWALPLWNRIPAIFQHLGQ